jgi:hypothetical protein
VLRLHLPLIEPDAQIFRIRLSDKEGSCDLPALGMAEYCSGNYAVTISKFLSC